MRCAADMCTHHVSNLLSLFVSFIPQLHPGTLRQQPVSGDTVADMLFIACNEGHSDAFHTLLEFDQTNTHALGTVPILTMKGSQRWGSKLAKTAQQQQGQLAEQLLLTCIAANQPLCMAQLVKVAPAVYYVSKCQ